MNDNWRREFLEDHGDPGPDDEEIDEQLRIEIERYNPCLNEYERNKGGVL